MVHIRNRSHTEVRGGFDTDLHLQAQAMSQYNLKIYKLKSIYSEQTEINAEIKRGIGGDLNQLCISHAQLVRSIHRK